MMLIEQIRDLERDVLSVYEQLIALQCRPFNQMENSFHDKISVRIKELVLSAAKIENRIDEKYLEKV